MIAGYLVNEREGHRIRLRRGDTFLRRLRGLLFTRMLPVDEGLLLSPCSSVHMVGMLYALDIVYLDQSRRIVKLVPDLRPFFGVSFCPGAAMTLELTAGSVERYGWRVGDQLIFLSK